MPTTRLFRSPITAAEQAIRRDLENNPLFRDLTEANATAACYSLAQIDAERDTVYSVAAREIDWKKFGAMVAACAAGIIIG